MVGSASSSGSTSQQPNAPIQQIVDATRASSDYLLPEQDDANDELDDDFFDPEICDEDDSRRELHEMLIPTALKEKWTALDNPSCLSSYYFKFCPNPVDRLYRKFGLFLKSPLPKEAERMRLDLHLDCGRTVLTELIPSGVSYFGKDELIQAEKFQRMFLKVILDRSEFIPEFVLLEDNVSSDLCSSTFYLLLPVLLDEDNKISVHWNLITRCLSSPILGPPGDNANDGISQRQLHLANGVRSFEDVINSLVYVPRKGRFFFITDVVTQKNGYITMKDSKTQVKHYNESCGIRLACPNQPLLKAKQLFCLDNLLRKKGNSELRAKVEHFIELPPEICQLKIFGFSKDIGSSLSLLPSIMHRLESLLVAIELKDKLSASFPEGTEVTVQRVLEALTTEKCNEHFSLERLEVLGDAFLKFAVGRHLFLLHDTLDEGQLTTKRSNIIRNSNLLNLATRKNLQVYIRDQSFEPGQFFALGRPCPVICTQETEKEIHSPSANGGNSKVRCSKCHHWLHKKTIADVFEALVGAFIVDSGFTAATAFLKWMGIQIDFKDSQVAKICCASTSFLPLADLLDTDALENCLGYPFVHKGLLIQAFLHPSRKNQLGGSYQRLEFLGDAVMDYLITSYLYSVYPKLKPGQLTLLRSASVNKNSFADVAIHCSFHKFIICNSSGLFKSMDKYARYIQTSANEIGFIEEPSCPKALGDLVESCMGAILLDTGFDLNCVWRIMLSLLNPAKRMAALNFFSFLKDQGSRSMSKSLEKVLRESEKMEARLIGYDETPSIVSSELYDLKLLEDSKNDLDFKRCPLNEVHQKNSCNNNKVMSQPDSSSGASGSQPRELRPLDTGKNGVLKSDSQEPGGVHNKSATARLHEICTLNHWKPPIFECCQETGPSHSREFTFKVMVEIDEGKILESHGEPRAKKKDTAEHAAEGALWYLKHEGYL